MTGDGRWRELTTVQSTEDMPLDEWERILNVNLHGTFHCCRAAIPHLRQRSSYITGQVILIDGGRTYQ